MRHASAFAIALLARTCTACRVTATPTEIPASLQTQTPEPMPSAATVLLALAGTGSKSSQPFAAPADQVTLIYIFDCNGVGSSGGFAFTLYDRTGVAITSVNHTAGTASLGTDTEPDSISNTSPPYHVAVHSNCAWAITVRA
jgi:hypothetical protein